MKEHLTLSVIGSLRGYKNNCAIEVRATKVPLTVYPRLSGLIRTGSDLDRRKSG